MRSRTEVMAEQEKLFRLLPEVQQRLRHIPAVTNIGIGAKEIGGRTTDDLASQAVCLETVTERGINTGLTTGRVADVLFEGSQILIEDAGLDIPATGCP